MEFNKVNNYVDFVNGEIFEVLKENFITENVKQSS